MTRSPWAIVHAITIVVACFGGAYYFVRRRRESAYFSKTMITVKIAACLMTAIGYSLVVIDETLMDFLSIYDKAIIGRSLILVLSIVMLIDAWAIRRYPE